MIFISKYTQTRINSEQTEGANKAMEELKKILVAHAKRYPQMQPVDAVKLVYQNEFGGGHLVANEEEAREALLREYASVERNWTVPLCEEIGGGLVRVNLTAVMRRDLDRLGDAFIASAVLCAGTEDRFRKKLDVLRQVAAQGCFRFAAQELEDYLSAYEQAGFPVVSHSPQYREAYKPAYRLVRFTQAEPF